MPDFSGGRRRRIKSDEDDDAFFADLAKPSKGYNPVKMVIPGHIYDDIYPPGTLVSIVNEIFDPFKEYTLEKNAIVTVESIDYKTPNNTWIVCIDQKGSKWAIRPRDIEKVNMETEKVGRFRILAMDTIMENQNKPQE